MDCARRTGQGGAEDDGGFLERLLASLATPAELAQAAQPRMPEQTLRVLAQFVHNDLLLASMGVSKEVSQYGSRLVGMALSGARQQWNQVSPSML